jgi:hypothetical protein
MAFLRKKVTRRKDGTVVEHYAVVESYRAADGKVRQRHLLYIPNRCEAAYGFDSHHNREYDGFIWTGYDDGGGKPSLKIAVEHFREQARQLRDTADIVGDTDEKQRWREARAQKAEGFYQLLKLYSTKSKRAGRIVNVNTRAHKVGSVQQPRSEDYERGYKVGYVRGAAQGERRSMSEGAARVSGPLPSRASRPQVTKR